MIKIVIIVCFIYSIIFPNWIKWESAEYADVTFTNMWGRLIGLCGDGWEESEWCFKEDRSDLLLMLLDLITAAHTYFRP